MSRPPVRTVLLCEDRTQEHFFRRLCAELGLRAVRVEVAPAGGGSGEQWVRRQYPGEVKRLRAQGRERVALLAATDGDRFGVSQRKESFAQALAEAGQAARAADERIAVCVPTWSIETWFAWLGGIEGLDEETAYKGRAFAGAQGGVLTPSQAALAWRSGPRAREAEVVPSLDDARLELRRLTP